MKEIIKKMMEMGFIGGVLFVFGLPVVLAVATVKQITNSATPDEKSLNKHERPLLKRENILASGSNSGRLYNHLDTQYYKTWAGWY